MSTFADILVRAENPIAAAMMLLLSWIATSDGDASDEEVDALRSIASAGKSESALDPLIVLARRGDIADLQLACEVLREIRAESRRLMLQMALVVALEDGYLTTGEGHIVRFAADLLQHSPSDLDALFQEMTGHPFPPPADPSTVEWWEEREGRWQGRSHERAGGSSTTGAGGNSQAGGGSVPDLQRLRDLAALGLDETANTDDVRAAYRRMAKVHHPDRFSSLGPEAVKAAHVSFRRIQQAYERLTTT
ncbi:MAG: DnaJ domain-containing protein [Phycisphaerales bacterium]|nr:DnaJ domain-containing protein [Phycisphaerales bacterium]